MDALTKSLLDDLAIAIGEPDCKCYEPGLLRWRFHASNCPKHPSQINVHSALANLRAHLDTFVTLRDVTGKTSVDATAPEAKP